jgi:hypothetical protein
VKNAETKHLLRVHYYEKHLAFLTGTSQDALIPIPLFYCTKCGHTNEEFLPIQLKEKTE